MLQQSTRATASATSPRWSPRRTAWPMAYRDDDHDVVRRSSARPGSRRHATTMTIMTPAPGLLRVGSGESPHCAHRAVAPPWTWQRPCALPMLCRPGAQIDSLETPRAAGIRRLRPLTRPYCAARARVTRAKCDIPSTRSYRTPVHAAREKRGSFLRRFPAVA